MWPFAIDLRPTPFIVRHLLTKLNFQLLLENCKANCHNFCLKHIQDKINVICYTYALTTAKSPLMDPEKTTIFKTIFNSNPRKVGEKLNDGYDVHVVLTLNCEKHSPWIRGFRLLAFYYKNINLVKITTVNC